MRTALPLAADQHLTTRPDLTLRKRTARAIRCTFEGRTIPGMLPTPVLGSAYLSRSEMLTSARRWGLGSGGNRRRRERERERERGREQESGSETLRPARQPACSRQQPPRRRPSSYARVQTAAHILYVMSGERVVGARNRPPTNVLRGMVWRCAVLRPIAHDSTAAHQHPSTEVHVRRPRPAAL